MIRALTLLLCATAATGCVLFAWGNATLRRRAFPVGGALPPTGMWLAEPIGGKASPKSRTVQRSRPKPARGRTQNAQAPRTTSRPGVLSEIEIRIR